MEKSRRKNIERIARGTNENEIRGKREEIGKESSENISAKRNNFNYN